MSHRFYRLSKYAFLYIKNCIILMNIINVPILLYLHMNQIILLLLISRDH